MNASQVIERVGQAQSGHDIGPLVTDLTHLAGDVPQESWALGVSRMRSVGFPTDGGRRVGSLSSNPGVHRWRKHEGHSHPGSRPMRSSSSPTAVRAWPRSPATSTSPRARCGAGSGPWTGTAPPPSPARASLRPRGRSGDDPGRGRQAMADRGYLRGGPCPPQGRDAAAVVGAGDAQPAGSDSVVALLGDALHRASPIAIQAEAWYPKAEARFSDVLAAVRREGWGFLDIRTPEETPPMRKSPGSSSIAYSTRHATPTDPYHVELGPRGNWSGLWKERTCWARGIRGLSHLGPNSPTVSWRF